MSHFNRGQETRGISPSRMALKNEKEPFSSVFLIVVVRTRDISSYFNDVQNWISPFFWRKMWLSKSLFIFHVSFKVNCRHLALLFNFFIIIRHLAFVLFYFHSYPNQLSVKWGGEFQTFFYINTLIDQNFDQILNQNYLNIGEGY